MAGVLDDQGFGKVSYTTSRHQQLEPRLLKVTTDPYAVVMRQMRKADILQKGGDRAGALTVYAETLPQVGRDTWLERELLAQIAEVFRRSDDLVGLQVYLNERIVAEPDRLALHKAISRTMTQLGQHAEALATLRRMVELTPGERANREDLITALAGTNQWVEAVAQQRSLISQFPADAEQSFKLAEFLRQGGQIEEVQQAFRDYLEKTQHSETVYMRVARTLAAYDWKEESRKTFDECLQRFETSTVVRDAYAAWLYQQNENPLRLDFGESRQPLLIKSSCSASRGC